MRYPGYQKHIGELTKLAGFFLPRSAETARDPSPCAQNAFNELNITCLIPPCFARVPSS